MIKKVIKKNILPFINKILFGFIKSIDYRDNNIDIRINHLGGKSISFLDTIYFKIHPNYYYAYWVNHFKNGIEHKSYFYITCENVELIGNGILLNQKKEIILESTIFQQEYLNKLLQNHLVLFRKSLRIEDNFIRAISLINFLDTNYYHWVLESLSRIALLYDEPHINLNETKILIRKSSKKFLKESLIVLFKMREENIVEWEGKRATIKDCIIPSFPLFRSTQVNYHVNNPNIISKIKDISIQNINTVFDFPKNIIITRKGTNQRNIINLSYLQNSFIEYDFHIVDLEEFTFKQQVQLFRKAKIIIGAHGAGLTNIIFSSNPLIIEFFPDKRNIRDMCIFFQISQALKFEHHIFILKSDSINQNMTIDSNTILTLADIFNKWSFL